MRPTVPVFLSLILLAGLLPASAEAGSIKCVKIGLTRCKCSSPYRIRCSNAEGHIQWNVLVRAVGLDIRDDRGSWVTGSGEKNLRKGVQVRRPRADT